MGMYTQLHYGAQLRTDVPESVIEILKVMVGDEETVPTTLPDDPLFTHDRWRWMLQCDSYYFDYKTTHLLDFDEIAKQWWFNVTCNLKNYEDEIALFVRWIAPYVDAEPGDFLGYHRYEEDEAPVLLLYPCIEVPTSVKQGA